MDFYSNPKKLSKVMNMVNILLLLIYLVAFSFIVYDFLIYKSDNYIYLFGNIVLGINMIRPILKYYEDRKIDK